MPKYPAAAEHIEPRANAPADSLSEPELATARNSATRATNGTSTVYSRLRKAAAPSAMYPAMRSRISFPTGRLRIHEFFMMA
jgi:hypothetical protein